MEDSNLQIRSLESLDQQKQVRQISTKLNYVITGKRMDFASIKINAHMHMEKEKFK